jgi:hypothetical protein
MAMSRKLLEIAQRHGDLAFRHGYEAALQGILIEDRGQLSKMPEAIHRLKEYGKLFDEIRLIKVASEKLNDYLDSICV